MANIVFCQMILTDNILSADSKKIRKADSQLPQMREGNKITDYAQRKKKMFEKKILNSHPINILIHRRSLSNHHQVMLINMSSSQVFHYKRKEEKIK